MKNSRKAWMGLLSAIVVGLLALPALASAADRNHDKIPDKWEKHYKLSLSVNQAKRDQDADGLRNRAEFQAGDNPRKADSDQDGTEDGSENAGTITSFTGGVLTIDLFDGSQISGTVTDATEIKCPKTEDETTTAPSSARSDGGNSGSGQGESGDDPASHQGPGENSGPGNAGQEGEHGNCNCTTADLTVGAVVAEAELELKNGTSTFDEIKLGQAATTTTAG